MYPRNLLAIFDALFLRRRFSLLYRAHFAVALPYFLVPPAPFPVLDIRCSLNNQPARLIFEHRRVRRDSLILLDSSNHHGAMLIIIRPSVKCFFSTFFPDCKLWQMCCWAGFFMLFNLSPQNIHRSTFVLRVDLLVPEYTLIR